MLLRERGSEGFEVRPEVSIGKELPRADYLLLRKLGGASSGVAAQTLRQLWPLLPDETVVELKTTGRPYRRKELHKLLAYTHWYYAGQDHELKQMSQLACALIVPRSTPSLRADVGEMGLMWHRQRGGYSRLGGAGFACHVVELDQVTDHEGDDVLGLFSYHKRRTIAARIWLARHVGGEVMTLQQYEDYDEVMAELLRQLTPEQRLAGLEPEQRLLSQSDDVLRALSPAFIDGLPSEVREAIIERIGEPGAG